MTSIERPKHIQAQDPHYAEFRKKMINQWMLWSFVSLSGVVLLGGLGFVIAILAMGWVLLQTALNIYHRLQIENFHHYRQLESIASLHALIKIRQPLPPMRLWAISPDFALLVATMIKEHRPKHIVELGSGTSTVISSYSLELVGQGKVTSYDHQQEFVDTSRRMIKRHELDTIATIRHAPLTDVDIDSDDWRWYDLEMMSDLRDIDLLIVDGPPEVRGKLSRYPALPALFDQLRDGAIILIDDVMREAETQMINRWLDEFDLEVIEVIPNEKGAAVLKKTTTTPVKSSTEVTDEESNAE